MTTIFIDTSDLLDAAAALSPLQRQLLLSLRERGPGLPLEIAMRVLKFPEEVNPEITDLRNRRLVQSSDFSGGALGSELVTLTSRGEQLAGLLRDENFRQQVERRHQTNGGVEPTRGVNSQTEEATLLRKLGELAERRGDLGEAANYYQQALEATRRLTTAVTS